MYVCTHVHTHTHTFARLVLCIDPPTPPVCEKSSSLRLLSTFAADRRREETKGQVERQIPNVLVVVVEHRRESIGIDHAAARIAFLCDARSSRERSALKKKKGQEIRAGEDLGRPGNCQIDRACFFISPGHHWASEATTSRHMSRRRTKTYREVENRSILYINPLIFLFLSLSFSLRAPQNLHDEKGRFSRTFRRASRVMCPEIRSVYAHVVKYIELISSTSRELPCYRYVVVGKTHRCTA